MQPSNNTLSQVTPYSKPDAVMISLPFMVQDKCLRTDMLLFDSKGEACVKLGNLFLVFSTASPCVAYHSCSSGPE